jgi:HTH-type transcriptional regulator/antitoxin HipB
MLPSEIGNTVRYHRKKSGLSQEELARVAGVGKTAVFDIEKGKETVKLSTITKILNALNIKITLSSPLMTTYMEQKREKS